MVGIGLDGLATFAGKHTGVQAQLKKHAPLAIFAHCHKLQLAIVQAANKTGGIKHVYTTLTTLRKFFNYSLKSQNQKEVQWVFDLLS